jgi:uncharacterized membrane protein (DUF2068 family)
MRCAWQTERMASALGQSPGLRAIVLYKAVKGAVQLGAALLLVALWPMGLPEAIRHLSHELREHATHGWALWLGTQLARGSSNHGILLGITALGLDGALTVVEAWALRSGRWWGAWLVVAATGSLLPFEAYELASKPHLSRVGLILANVVIVSYLVRRTRREGSGRDGAAEPPATRDPERAPAARREEPPLL